MICVASFLVLSILGAFSIRHRALAKEAWRCVFLRLRLRPCETGFDVKMKSKITARLMRHPGIANFWRRHFQAISFAFTLLMVVSFYLTTAATYNIIRYGTCSPGRPCVLDSFPEALSEKFHIPSTWAGGRDKRVVEIDFFYDASACPNFERINEFFEQRIKAVYPAEINQYEISRPGNSELARKLAKTYGTAPRSPMIFVGDFCIKECTRAGLRELEEAVRATIRTGSSAPMSRLK